MRVVGFELPVADLPLPAAEPGFPIACEIRADDAGHRVLEEIASAAGDYIGKFRTGGTTAEAFPDEATVASVVVDAVRVGAPMKFTAGLHHAVRFRDEQTGFEHHGFVNLMVAVHAALGGAGERDVASILHQRSGDDLAAEIASWSPRGRQGRTPRLRVVRLLRSHRPGPRPDRSGFAARPRPRRGCAMSWIEEALGLDAQSAYGIATLPYAVGSPERERPVVLVRIGDRALDLAEVSRALDHPHRDVFAQPSLNALMALGRQECGEVRAWVRTLLTDDTHRELVEQQLISVEEVELQLPFEVADYVDFYASEVHASNVGKIFRPDSPGLPPNWKHLPIGYHGRAGTVVVSGSDVVRPTWAAPAGSRRGAAVRASAHSRHRV